MAGETVYLGGISTLKEFVMSLYQPGSDKVWLEKKIQVSPNHTFSWEVRLPENITGEYRVVADTAEMKFNVVKKTDGAHSSDTPKENGNVHTPVQQGSVPQKADGITVMVDGIRQDFGKVMMGKDNEVMVPMKGLFEALHIQYEVKGKVITATKSTDTIIMTLEQMNATVNSQNMKMPAAAEEIHGEYMVPARFIAEQLGYKCSWDKNKEILTIGTKEKNLWWYKYPTQAESNFVEDSDARSSRQNYGADFAWGMLAQKASYNDTKPDIDVKRAYKKRLVTYFEASGQLMPFAIGYNQALKDGLAPFFNMNAWGMKPGNIKTLKYITYTGLHNDINNDVTVSQHFTRESLGYSIPLYPNGKDALGYIDNPELPFPVNAKLYDMACARGIDGNVLVEYSMPYNGPVVEGLANVKVGSRTLKTYPGKNAGDVLSFLNMNLSKDISAPFWKEHAVITGKEFMKNGMDGAWFDNMSPWDNFQGVYNGFGEWSEFKFNRFLAERFTLAQLSEMGIQDIGKFNVREYMMKVAVDLGAVNPAEKGAAYKDTLWLEDPVWNAYKVFKQQQGSDYLKYMYKVMKDEAKAAGRTDGFAVLGNDMPGLNHGWIQDDWLDICGTEAGAGWSLTFGSRGILPPPVGKMSVLYRAAIENQSGPYAVVWYYSDDKLKNKSETSKVLLAEAFANNTFIKRANDTVGMNGVHRWLNRFAYREEENFGTRYERYDIAIVYSPENQLGNMVPDSLQGSDLNAQYHMQGMWGFAHALTDANIPYRIIPEWKVNSQTLKGIKTLILPNLECMDEDMVQLYREFAENGGRLVVTGPAGGRYGDAGYFARRNIPAFNELVKQDVSVAPGNDLLGGMGTDETFENKLGQGQVIWIAKPIGHSYFQNLNSRSKILPQILTMVGGTQLFDGTSLPLTVGAYLWQSADGQDVFVDLVNYNVDLEADKVKQADQLTFKVRLPDGISHVNALAICPEENYTINPIVENGWATITVPKLEIYTSIKLTDADKESTEKAPASATPQNGQKDKSGVMNTMILILMVTAGIGILGAVIVMIRVKGKKRLS